MSRLLKNTSTIALATFLSRILGFVRDIVVAYALGTGPFADAFFVAFRLPNLMRRLFAEGSLTMAFVPVFKEIKHREGRERAFCFARSTFVWLLIILSCLTAMVIIGAPVVTFLIAPGFKKDPSTFAFAVYLVRVCFPYVIFISSVALCMGILNSLGHFAAPAYAPCVLNIVLITCALLAVKQGWNVAGALAWGVLVAGLLQFLLQQVPLKKKGFSWRGKVSLKDKGVRLLLTLMIPTVFGAAVYQIGIIINTILASFLPEGAISYLYYADRLVQFPLGVFGVAVSVAALPDLSSLATKGDMEEFKHTLNAGLSLILFVSLPATAGLIGLAHPIIKTLFFRGAFTETSVMSTSLALIGYAVGLPAFSCVRTLVSSFYALKDTKSPVVVATICLVVNVILGISLMKFFSFFGLALAVSLSSFLNIFLLCIFLRKKIGPWFVRDKKYIIMPLLSLIILIGGMYFPGSDILRFALIPVWAVFYLVFSYILGVEEAHLMLKILPLFSCQGKKNEIEK